MSTLELLARVVAVKCPYLVIDSGEYYFVFEQHQLMRINAMMRHTRYVVGSTIAAWARREARIQRASQMCSLPYAREMDEIADQIESWGES